MSIMTVLSCCCSTAMGEQGMMLYYVKILNIAKILLALLSLLLHFLLQAARVSASLFGRF